MLSSVPRQILSARFAFPPVAAKRAGEMASDAPAAGANLTAAMCKRSNRVARVLAYALLEWILIALLLANGVFSYLISKFAAASGKALLSWMRRSELGERDLACACCGVALESGFYSPSFLLPGVLTRDLDGGYKEDAIACLNGDVVFVSEDGPVIELFDEKPLVEEDSIGVMAAHCADIVGNVEQPMPLESTGSLAMGMDVVSSQSGVEEKEEVDHETLELGYVAPENMVNEENFVVASDDDKLDFMVDRLIDGEIASLVVSVASMENEFNIEINAGETTESLADQRSPLRNNGLKGKYQAILNWDEISEDEQVEQDAVKQELFSMPSDPREHEAVVRKSDGKAEEDPVQQAFKNEWDCMAMEGDERISEASNENNEDMQQQVQQAELNQELDLLIRPRENADEEFEQEKIAPAELQQEELDSVALDFCEQVHVASSEGVEEEHVGQPELKHLSTFMTACKDGIKVDPTEALLPSLHHLSYGPSISLDKLSPDCNDIEDKRVPDTLSHIEGISSLQELMDPKAVTSDTKSVDSSDATMSTDMESVELVSVDQLKSALAAARKSLNTLYTELENERSAAAIAADETMAMINRLQEQKAAMQMEAMQYQRLMEEQSEYNQEALQRVNELVVKRDKERQDMEREIELYRHKIHLYEAKERRKMSRHKADDQNGSSSASSSAEDSDDLSQSFYEGDESSHGLNGSNGSIPTDIVLQETATHIVTLDSSLADCDEERLSILEQLKVLEDRLFDLEDEESDSMKEDKHFTEDNHLSSASNGFSDEDISFKLHDSRKGVSYRGKKLLPLFDDATAMQNGNGLLTKQCIGADPSAEVMSELAKEQDKLAIANEIDQVHERLHALEADKEFIKQCVRSLNKGGKGFVLLQEILQHLRDLRRIEQRARNIGDLSPHYVHPYTD